MLSLWRLAGTNSVCGAARDPVAGPPLVSRITEAALLAALRLRFTYSGNGGAGRYALLTHVRTGAAWNQQEIDAVAFCLWPSDHHALLGFEIKCTRTDWLREIKPDTSKSTRPRELCDSFTIVAPAGVVADGELPEGWGLIVATLHDGRTIHLRQQVTPVPKNAHPLDNGAIPRSFLAALLRAAGVVPGMTTGLKRAAVDRAQLEAAEP